MSAMADWPQSLETRDRGFLVGPRSRLRESRSVIRIAGEFVRGFRRLHFVGPCITVFGSARVVEGEPAYDKARAVAAAASRLGFTIITGIGAWGGVPTGPMQIPDLPAYPTVRIVDMALAIVVGVVVALLIAAARTVARRVSDSRPRLGTGPTLVIGGLVVGLLAQAIVALGGTYDLVLFSGQLALPALLAESSAWLVLAVIAAKVLGFALCLGVGFRGGPVFPAIFIGAGVATLIGMPFGMSATVALAIGIAAGMTSFTRLVFSSLVFTLLLEGTQGLSTAPVAVLAAATAWLVGHALDTRAAGSSP